VRNVNFGGFATFLCRATGIESNWCDVITLTFDLWRHRACRRCGSLYSICLPSFKFVGLPIPKIRVIFCYGIKRPGDLDLWPFDFESGAECHPCKYNFSAHFGISATFCCRLVSKNIIRLTTRTYYLEVWRHHACRWRITVLHLWIPSLNSSASHSEKYGELIGLVEVLHQRADERFGDPPSKP